VGGIGGAILIGGIALVAWRLWGKKKHTKLPQDEDLSARPSSTVVQEKPTPTGSMGSRFSDPLDRYHSPGRPVNTASNF